MGADKRSLLKAIKRVDEGLDQSANNSVSAAETTTSTEVPEINDEESGEEDEDFEQDMDIMSSNWEYPVVVPEGAKPGCVITVPLPGDEVAYAPVGEEHGVGDVIKVPMSSQTISACVADAVKAINCSTPHDHSQAAASTTIPAPINMVHPIKGAQFIPGVGSQYAAEKGRERFAFDAFLALREVTALSMDLPPMEGWMLKRGDKMAKGSMNR